MEIEKINFQDLRLGLFKEIPLNLYEVEETEATYSFTLKDDILEASELIKFLMDQYKLLNVQEKTSKEIIARLKNISKVEDIINLAKEKSYPNFQYSTVIGYLYCGEWHHRLMAKYGLLDFYVEGKIIMECYNDFLHYIESLIKRNNPHRVSEAVKVMIG